MTKKKHQTHKEPKTPEDIIEAERNSGIITHSDLEKILVVNRVTREPRRDKNHNALFKPRGVVHRGGYYHVAVHLLIINVEQQEGSIILQFRNRPDDLHRGQYSTSAAGHVRKEDYADNPWMDEYTFVDRYMLTAKRELKEELGIEGICLSYVAEKQISEREEGQIDNEFRNYYLGYWQGQISPNPDECDTNKSRFYSVSEINKMLRSGKKFTQSLIIGLRYLKGAQSEYFGHLNV